MDYNLKTIRGRKPPNIVRQRAYRVNEQQFSFETWLAGKRTPKDEAEALRSQFVTLNVGRGQHRKYLPYAFTEHGAFMAASVLNSPRAVEVSVFVVRAFVKLRQLVLAHKDLAAKLDQLERKVGSHDEAIKQLVAAIRQLMAPPDSPKNRIGFHTIRDSAKEKSEPSERTSSVKPRKRRRRANA